MTVNAVQQLISEMDDATRQNFTALEQWFLFRSMKICEMDRLPDVTGDPSGEYCGGAVTCNVCGEECYSHPMDWRLIGYGNVPFLRILCDGRRVKL